MPRRRPASFRRVAADVKWLAVAVVDVHSAGVTAGYMEEVGEDAAVSYGADCLAIDTAVGVAR